MKLFNKITSALVCLAILFFSSCGDDGDSTTPVNEPPGSFSVSVSNITLSSATVEWTQAIDPDGDAVTYSVSLNGATAASSVTGTSLDLSDLNEDTSYSGTVTATDGNGGSSSSNFSFITNGNQNPEMFTVTVDDITEMTAILNWSESVDPDGDDVTYRVLLDGTEIVANLTATSFNLTELMASTDYTGNVEVSDGNGGITSASYSFTTLDAENQDPGEFTASVTNISKNSATLTWTEATDSDGDNVTYRIMLAGNEVANELTELTFELTELMADTDYQGRVFASDGEGGESEAMFSFTTTSDETETCANDNSIDQDNRPCTLGPDSNTYDDSNVNGAGDREIVTNGIPTHEYGNQIPDLVDELDNSTKTYRVDNTPTKAASVTSITGTDGRPDWRFGVATNGVAIDPAPAEPFIFENTETGEYNWDWVMEPNNNMNAVGLDCAIAHVQPEGLYHNHGDFAIYAEELSAGISSGSAPSSPIQIGWAADGFPIFYYYGPTVDGSGVELLSSSYRLKTGERSGDGISEPCGEYNGKYTNDYEYAAGTGDLDECNGIDRSVTLATGTYSYFYVITPEFPIISRCIVGTPNNSLKIGP